MKVDSKITSIEPSCRSSQDGSDDDFKRIKDIDASTEVKEEKIGSVMIIFNTWNAMIGVGTVTVPWAYQQSGIVNGIIVTAIACVISFATNMVYLETAGKDDNYSVTMQRYFPQYGWSTSMLCFIVNFYVGIILFFQVLS